jgi:phage terminase small subunit
MALTDKDERFAYEYIVDGNKTKAAIRAGFSARSASQIGSRLFKNVEFLSLVKRLQRGQRNRLQLDADMVKKGLLDIAQADLRKLFDKDGKLRPITDLPSNLAKALGGIEIRDVYEGVGKDRKKVGVTVSYKLSDVKVKAWELLGKTKELKMFTDKVELDPSKDLIDEMRAARERAYGKKRN